MVLFLQKYQNVNIIHIESGGGKQIQNGLEIEFWRQLNLISFQKNCQIFLQGCFEMGNILINGKFIFAAVVPTLILKQIGFGEKFMNNFLISSNSNKKQSANIQYVIKLFKFDLITMEQKLRFGQIIKKIKNQEEENIMKMG